MASQLTLFNDVQDFTLFPLLNHYLTTFKGSLRHSSNYDVNLFLIESFKHKCLLQSALDPKL